MAQTKPNQTTDSLITFSIPANSLWLWFCFSLSIENGDFNRSDVLLIKILFFLLGGMKGIWRLGARKETCIKWTSKSGTAAQLICMHQSVTLTQTWYCTAISRYVYSQTLFLFIYVQIRCKNLYLHFGRHI
jgi:hypothetical protein